MAVTEYEPVTEYQPVTEYETDGADGAPLTDDELTMLALSCDPEMALADDAVCVWDVIGEDQDATWCNLPEWYMPAPKAGARPERKRWHRWVAVGIIASFLLIDGLGLCITYGQLIAA